VVKAGGSSSVHWENLAEDLSPIIQTGANVVVVHGGGRDLSDALLKSGIKPKFVDGLRVTTQEVLDLAIMVLAGKLNKALVIAMSKHGISSLGICGSDAGLIKVVPETAFGNLGFVGRISKIDSSLLYTAWQHNIVPIVAPVANDFAGQMYNLNADTVAGEIAESISANHLIFVTDVDGVLDESGNTVPVVTRKLADQLKGNGVITEGMIPKIDSALRRLDKVDKVHIINGSKRGAIHRQLSKGDAGTTFIRE
tara:strand:- start:2386 stop:3144 length:759 start_codon:yes stop_codon:yes gene_type:complete